MSSQVTTGAPWPQPPLPTWFTATLSSLPGDVDHAIKVTTPATGRQLVEVPTTTPETLRAMATAAATQQTSWAAQPDRDRARILHTTATLMLQRQSDLGDLICLEAGKPLAEARAEVAYAAGYFRWAAEQCVQLGGHTGRAPGGSDTVHVTHSPVGLCYLITPWNFPLAMVARKVAPALAAGCAAVVKPSDLTPLSTLALHHVLIEAGLPTDLVQVCLTNDPHTATTTVLDTGLVRKVSFTGSTRVGAAVGSQALQSLARVSLELGGNAPALVFDDANLDTAVAAVVTGKLRNAGQTCVAMNRLMVHESVKQAFLDRLTEAFRQQVCGPGWYPTSTIGPMITPTHADKVEQMIANLTAAGGRICTGGERVILDGGHYIQPTLIDIDANPSVMADDEIFGPVLPIRSFRTDDEAWTWANNTRYGLAAYVMTNDLTRALDAPTRIDSGMIGVNTGLISDPDAPFGGVRHSGMGREGGPQGLADYQSTRYLRFGR